MSTTTRDAAEVIAILTRVLARADELHLPRAVRRCPVCGRPVPDQGRRS